MALGVLLLPQVKCGVAGGEYSGRRRPGQPWEAVPDTSVRGFVPS